jgi:hypothetical protein
MAGIAVFVALYRGTYPQLSRIVLAPRPAA